MSEQHIRLRAVDSWFFRGARPLFSGEGGQSDIEAMFPPWPDTVVGAMRAAWARAMGWPGGRAGWDKNIKEKLGDGFDDDAFAKQRLWFDGPHVITWASDDGGEGDEPQLWYPMPLNLLGAGGKDKDNEPTWTPTARLAPGEPLGCDLGDDVALPEVVNASGDVAGGKTGDDFWVSHKGMQRILAGRMPEVGDIRHKEALWSTEYRVGLARDNTTRAAKDGMLYSTRHIRLSRCTGLGLTVHHAPAEGAPQVLTLGGESRVAECDTVSATLPHPRLDDQALLGADMLAVVLITPARLPKAGLKLGEQVPGLEGFTLVSGCVGKTQRVGGWATVSKRGGGHSREVKSHLPAGSVLFVKCNDLAQRLKELERWHLGERTRWGYGRFLLGVARPPQDTHQDNDGAEETR